MIQIDEVGVVPLANGNVSREDVKNVAGKVENEELVRDGVVEGRAQQVVVVEVAICLRLLERAGVVLETIGARRVDRTGSQRTRPSGPGRGRAGTERRGRAANEGLSEAVGRCVGHDRGASSR